LTKEGIGKYKKFVIPGLTLACPVLDTGGSRFRNLGLDSRFSSAPHLRSLAVGGAWRGNDKNKKMKNNEKSPKNRLVRMIVFHEMFKKMIEKEKSGFGGLLLQENLICFEIIKLLRDIDYYFKIKLGIGRSFINIDGSIEELERKTLGQLIEVVRLFLSGEDDVIKYLKHYNGLRTKLTHKMLFGKYKETKDLYIDAEKAYVYGRAALSQIAKLEKYFSQFYKMKMGI